MTPKIASLCLVFFGVTLVIVLARYYGWVSPDSWNYLSLAQHLTEGNGLHLHPDWGDNYWAVFPAGYPLCIALVHALLGVDFLTASKVLNGCLLASSICIAARLLDVPLLLSASFFLSAPLLEIVSYTWSENLFIFSNLLALFTLRRYLQKGNFSQLAYYVFALMLAVSSRYIGGFLIGAYIVIIITQFKQIQRKHLLSALRITGIVGVFFAAYLTINIYFTGHATGMLRTPATESFFMLFDPYTNTIIMSACMLLPPIILMLNRTFFNKQVSALAHYPKAIAPITFGLTYILVLFALRLHTSFDMLDDRLLTPGTLFIWLGILHIIYTQNKNTVFCTGLRAYALFLLLLIINLGFTYEELVMNPRRLFSESAHGSMNHYKEKFGDIPEGSVVILANYPRYVGWNFASPIFASNTFAALNLPLYEYGPLSLERFQEYLKNLRYKSQPPVKYLFDFRAYADISSLEKALQSQQAAPDFAEWMKSHFSPHAWVECVECKQE